MSQVKLSKLLRIVLLTLLSFNFLTYASAETRIFTIAYNENTSYMLPLVEAIYKEMGVPIQFTLTPSERALSGTNRNLYDADLARVANSLSLYPNLMFTNEPIKKTELYSYIKKDSKIMIKNASDLDQYTVGLVRGSRLAEMYASQHGLTTEVANTADALYSMLTNNRFKVALITSTQVASQQKQIAQYMIRSGPVLDTTNSFHVLNKRHKDLAPKFDSILKKMKSDGRYKNLLPSEK